MTSFRPALLIIALAFACGDSSPTPFDAGTDSAPFDASRDTTPQPDAIAADAGEDAADAGQDASFDAGECATASDGTPCDLPPGSPPGLCIEGVCVVSECGDGWVHALTEECDDGNREDGDACPSDCQFECNTNEDCAPADACEGAPLCNEMHQCVSGEPTVCDDADPCTIDSCDPATGCIFEPADADDDGYVAGTLPIGCDLVEGDCNDDDATVHPGAEELCEDGEAVDNDCDGEATDGPPPRYWFADCDGDGVAAGDAPRSPLQCAPPAPLPDCDGGWTEGELLDRPIDCNDANADVFPGQEMRFETPIPGTDSFDYNCDGESTTTDRCGGSCHINYTLGICSHIPGNICVDACGESRRVVRRCSGAVRCLDVSDYVVIRCH